MSPLGTGRLGRRDSDGAAHPYARRYGDALGIADSAMAGQVVDEAHGPPLSGVTGSATNRRSAAPCASE